jgi:hypothetical protein
MVISNSASALRRGHVAEWLRNGLQNRVPRFNSGRGLQRNQTLSSVAARPEICRQCFGSVGKPGDCRKVTEYKENGHARRMRPHAPAVAMTAPAFMRLQFPRAGITGRAHNGGWIARPQIAIPEWQKHAGAARRRSVAPGAGGGCGRRVAVICAPDTLRLARRKDRGEVRCCPSRLWITPPCSRAPTVSSAQLAIGVTAVTAQATELRLVAGGIALATAHLT